jgi:DNA (cytosine-5)-methyltransferase 1
VVAYYNEVDPHAVQHLRNLIDAGHIAPGVVDNGFWRDADWLHGQDGWWRPVRPGSFPLANGVPARVGRVRTYGNAINIEAAAAFIKSYMAAVDHV